MDYEDIFTKSDKRIKKRKTKENKWIKHGYGENWETTMGENISKFQKKLIKEKLKIIKK